MIRLIAIVFMFMFLFSSTAVSGGSIQHLGGLVVPEPSASMTLLLASACLLAVAKPNFAPYCVVRCRYLVAGGVLAIAGPLSAEFPIAQLPSSVLSPEWVTQEHKLMGWRPLDSFDFFDDMLLPPEYHQAIDVFKPSDASAARTLLHRRYTEERRPPHPGLVLGLLYERAGDRESAIRSMQQAADGNRRDPDTLTDVARWEMTNGLHNEARKHTEAALALWPEHPQATRMARQLDEAAVAAPVE